MNTLSPKLPLTALMTPYNSSTITRTHRIAIGTFDSQVKTSKID